MERIDLTTPPTVTRSLITFVLDRSGSMGICKAATIEAFNAYLCTLREEKAARIYFTLITFDSVSVDKLHVATPVGDVPLLTNETYVPRAGTPLIDACVKAIHAVEEQLAKRADNSKVVICIQTDGQENASREFLWGHLSDLVAQKKAQGWQFNFMGVGIDAYHQGYRMGLGREETVAYNVMDMASTRAVFTASAANATSFVTGQSTNTAYTQLQKKNAGDVIDAAIITTKLP